MSALAARRAVRVTELSEDLGVSEITIRRDLVLLEREGVLKRTYGGAVMRRRVTDEQDYARDVTAQSAEKTRIAKVAAAMIEPRDTIFLGSGSTAAQVPRHIEPGTEARIVTHNLAAAHEARDPSVEFVFLGGLYRPQLGAVGGSWSLDMIGQFNADKTLLGADCLDVSAGLTTAGLAVADLELAMIRRTRGEVIVMADSAKIGLVGPVVICPLDQIDVVVVDSGLSVEICQEIERAGPQCEVV